ncbi:IS66 family transposase [Zobellia galactanivorans]
MSSAIGKSIFYTLKLWSKLIAYTSGGSYEIDNNRIEIPSDHWQ